MLHDVTLGGTGKEHDDRHPKIRYGVMIGAGAKILGNIEVGHCARIAAGSVVVKPVPNNVTVAGVPAKVIGVAGCPEPARTMDQMFQRRDLTANRWRCRLRRLGRQANAVFEHDLIRTRYPAYSGSCSRRDAVDVQEVRKLDAYLKKLFGNARIRVVPRPKKDDSAEVYVGEEFIGVLFVDDEDDERSYNFQMAILGHRSGSNSASGLCLRLALRMQLRDQPVEAGGDIAPIAKPIARKPQRDLGGIEHALVDAGAGHRAAPAACSGRRIARDWCRDRPGLRPRRACRRGTAGWRARPGRRSPASRHSADRWCAAARAAAAPRPRPAMVTNSRSLLGAARRGARHLPASSRLIRRFVVRLRRQRATATSKARSMRSCCPG